MIFKNARHRLWKVIGLVAALFLAACERGPEQPPRPLKTYDILQLNADGSVARRETVTRNRWRGNCVSFQTVSRPDVNQAMCGSIFSGVSGGFDRTGTPSLEAKYIVTLYDSKNNVIRRWAVVNYYLHYSMIGFKSAEDPGNMQHVSGVVTAGPAPL